MRSGTQPCNLNLQLPPTDVSVSGNKLQASLHILYATQLYWAREGLPGADCDTVISKRAMPSHLTSSCVISSQGAWVPKVTGVLISPWINYLGRRRHRVPQGLSAGDACGPWGKPRATVHNRLEANSKVTFRAAIKALQLSRHVSPLGLHFYSRPRTFSVQPDF